MLRVAFILFVAIAAQAAAPLVRLHSHNDYEHEHPLADALDHGFWSVEADVWLTNGQLLVAHDFNKTSPQRTLQSLYLDPLRVYVQTHSAYFATSGPITLLIDVKSDATNTWRALDPLLRSYGDLFSRIEDNRIQTNAVIAIISGNRAPGLVASERVRYAAIDGRLPDLESNAPPALIPLVSDNWTKHFKWNGQGTISNEERDKLRAMVAKAHTQKRRVRFWATPETETCWRELLDAGVDLLNTDRLAEAETFLRK